MALVERDGRVYARKLWIFLGAKEWGNELMRQMAREAFATDASLDAVEVHEHGGWYLTFLRDGTVVGHRQRSSSPRRQSQRVPEQHLRLRLCG